MALDGVGNFGKVEVSTGYDASATSIVLATDDGAKLPDPSGDNYNVVWYNWTDYKDPADDPNVEIVRVTAKSTDTLTVTRAQESTGASTKNTADKIYKMVLGATAKMITDIETDLGNKIEADSTDTLTNKTFDANGTGNSLSNVDVADLADGTDGELITWDATGAPATVAAGTADQVLTSNGAGAAPTFQDAGGGGGNKTIWIPAYGVFTTGSITAIGDSSAAAFDDAVSDQAWYNWSIPDDFTAITSVKIYWATGATSANANFEFTSRAVNLNESISTGGSSDSLAATTYASSSTSNGLNIDNVTAAFNGLTISANDEIGFTMKRNGGDASDTLGATAYLLGWQIVYS